MLILLVASLVGGLAACPQPTFRLLTGRVPALDTSEPLTAPALDTSEPLAASTAPALLDCIDRCRHQHACRAFSYESGQCKLFSEAPLSPEALTVSQREVFAVFGEKLCGLAGCQRAWAFETFPGARLNTTPNSRVNATSSIHCADLCIQQTSFICRSANFGRANSSCDLSEHDRFSLGDVSAAPDSDYLESNCARDPASMCDFAPLSGHLLSSVDALVEGVATPEACRRLCTEANHFRCRTYDYGALAAQVCRLSHHWSQSVQDISQPYLTAGGSSHQLTACYEVTVGCEADAMVARVSSSSTFRGRVYAKARPNSCTAHVDGRLSFELRLAYRDLGCDLRQQAPGNFAADVIIQHHDQIVTGQDLGVSVRCLYNLEARTVGQGVQLAVGGEPQTLGSEEASFILSPTVTMRITDRAGQDIHTAQVGDPLSLRFHILDQDTPYQIFVRELIALDGVDSSEILLIDSLGCPTDPTIMGPITAINSGELQLLEAPFDAFKFPTSNVVQFKALVTPCLPKCEPVVCSMQDYYGAVRNVDSFGRRKRDIPLGEKKVDSFGWRRSDPQGKEKVVVQSIRIEDKFQFNKLPLEPSGITPESDFDRGENACGSGAGLIAIVVVLFCMEILLAVTCLTLWQRKSQAITKAKELHRPEQTAPQSMTWQRFYGLF